MAAVSWPASLANSLVNSVPASRTTDQAVARVCTDVVVRSLVVSDAQPVAIDYRVCKSAQGWHAYDLNIAGSWLIQTYKQDFNEKIGQSGIDGLIAFLTKFTEASAGQSATP